eukprot:766032-Hanusia_phi.AAC.1
MEELSQGEEKREWEAGSRKFESWGQDEVKSTKGRRTGQGRAGQEKPLLVGTRLTRALVEPWRLFAPTLSCLCSSSPSSPSSFSCAPAMPDNRQPSLCKEEEEDEEEDEDEEEEPQATRFLFMLLR